MAACAFTWSYLVVIVMVASGLGYLPTKYLQLSLDVGYVVILLPVLGSGLAIWLDSVTTAWRKRDATSAGVAGWNTFAQAHNTYEAISTLPDAVGRIGASLAGGDDDDAEGKVVLVAIVLVAVILCGGVLTTMTIVRSTARRYAASVLKELGGRDDVETAHAS